MAVRRSAPRFAGISKYAEAGRISLVSKLAYLGDFAARSIFMVVILFIFMQIWKKAIPAGDALAGLSASDMVWYMAMTETVMLSMPKLEGTICDDVKTGSIGYLLGRPMDYVVYQYATFAGEIVLRLAVNGIIASATAYVFAGPIHVSPAAVGAWALTMALGATLSFHICACLALLAFWVEDVLPLFWIYNKLLFTLGGLFAPVAIYPKVLRAIAEGSPFNYVFAAPAKLFVSFSGSAFVACLIQQTLWLLGFIALSRLVYSAGVKRVNVNGG